MFAFCECEYSTFDLPFLLTACASYFRFLGRFLLLFSAVVCMDLALVGRAGGGLPSQESISILPDLVWLVGTCGLGWYRMITGVVVWCGEWMWLWLWVEVLQNERKPLLHPSFCSVLLIYT